MGCTGFWRRLPGRFHECHFAIEIFEKSLAKSSSIDDSRCFKSWLDASKPLLSSGIGIRPFWGKFTEEIAARDLVVFSADLTSQPASARSEIKTAHPHHHVLTMQEPRATRSFLVMNMPRFVGDCSHPKPFSPRILHLSNHAFGLFVPRHISPSIARATPANAAAAARISPYPPARIWAFQRLIQYVLHPNKIHAAILNTSFYQS